MAYNDTPPVYAGEQKDSPRGLVDQPQLTYAEFLVSPLAKAFDEQFPTWLPRNSNSADEPEQQAETEDKAASTGPSMFGPPLVSIEEARPSQERSSPQQPSRILPMTVVGGPGAAGNKSRFCNVNGSQDWCCCCMLSKILLKGFWRSECCQGCRDSRPCFWQGC
jgi:hypothetical protein